MDEAKERDLVSIVIPCFNSEQWVDKAIKSALAQTWLSKEIIVIDDGSTDGSYEIIRKFKEHIRFERKEHAGVCATRNDGMSIAKGQWIQFLDADDILHPQRLEILIRAHRQWPTADFVWALNEQFSGECVPNSFLHSYRQEGAQASLSTSPLEAAYAPSAALFRADFLRKVGQWNEDLVRWVDLEYHARIARACRSYVKVSTPLYGYRQHTGRQISNANRTGQNIKSAIDSLERTKKALTCKEIPLDQRDACLFPFYVQLARAAASNGDRITFSHCLNEASELSHRLTFRLKAKLARTYSKLFGVKSTSRLITFALQQR
jgi:glycosyltransferase involved in cell wall biosynthesis